MKDAKYIPLIAVSTLVLAIILVVGIFTRFFAFVFLFVGHFLAGLNVRGEQQYYKLIAFVDSKVFRS